MKVGRINITLSDDHPVYKLPADFSTSRYIRVTSPGAVSLCEMSMNYLLGVRGHDASDIYLHF